MLHRILLIQSDVDDALIVRNSLLAIPDVTIELEWLESCAEGERRLGIAPSATVAGITAILCDLFLPDSQGIGTVERLMRAAPHIPILLFCSLHQEDIAKLAVQRGAHDYLWKYHLNSHTLEKALRSMTGRKANMDMLLREQGRAQTMLDSLGDAIVSVDVRGAVTYLNGAAESLTGWSRQEAVGQTFEKVMPIIDAMTRKAIPNPLAAAMLRNETGRLPPDCICVRRDGVEIAIEDSSASIHDRHGQLTGAVMVLHDVSAARAQSQKLARLAHHDGLTDLPNSTLFADRLTQAMALAHRHGHKLAVIFLDMDHFKHVNDSLGHIDGDCVLQSVARRLQSCVRNTDTVSRRGGDEFVVLLSEVAQAEDAGLCAGKILAALNAPHYIGQGTVQITASMGIATFPEDGTEAETLLRNADFAMYHAKSSGRSCYQFFKPELNTHTVVE